MSHRATRPLILEVSLKTFKSGFSTNNIFAGFIVAVVALPLCIAFAIASGANPMAGIVSGVAGGFIAGLFGSSRFQVSGPAAAFITIIYGLIAEHGPQVLLAATFLAGLVVIAIGLLRLGKAMELMPHSVIVGFTTGIGVLILLGQIPPGLGIEAKGHDIIEKLAYTATHLHDGNPWELVVMIATVVTAILWSRTRMARWLPAPLVALLAGTALSLALARAGHPVRTIGALYEISVGSVGISPDFLTALTTHLDKIVPAAFTLGILIAVESLLSSKALDAMTNTRHDPDRELFGLGLANLVVPFIGGLPASGVIVRGSTNVVSGGTEKTAAILHAVFLAAFVALLYDAIGLLPMASLAAVLLLTARRLIEVHEIRTIARIDTSEGMLTVLTVLLTVTIDLTVSVPVGIALMLVLALRGMLSDHRVDVHDVRGQAVLTVNHGIIFLTSASLAGEIAARLADGKVRTLNLCEMSYLDATGALMLADLLDRHPHVQVWVAERTNSDRLHRAGVARQRIALVGNRVVNLPEVFQRIQASGA